MPSSSPDQFSSNSVSQIKYCWISSNCDFISHNLGLILKCKSYLLFSTLPHNLLFYSEVETGFHILAYLIMEWYVHTKHALHSNTAWYV